jgi:hypothetical protein
VVQVGLVTGKYAQDEPADAPGGRV